MDVSVDIFAEDLDLDLDNNILQTFQQLLTI